MKARKRDDSEWRKIDGEDVTARRRRDRERKTMGNKKRGEGS
jgi:hypothetical protein